MRLFSLLSVCFLSNSVAFAKHSTGELKLKVLIIDNLKPTPVPYTDFSIVQEFGKNLRKTFRTDEAGNVDTNLEAGKYLLESVKPLAFKGSSFKWRLEFTISGGKALRLKITDADATLAAARTVGDEARIYQTYKPAVVTVESDFGQGSGFVVDSSGLILTNQHLTNGTHWLGVRFKPGLRFEATLVQEDKDADVAVIRVNPSAVRDLVVVPLANPTRGAIATEGEKVIAIGNPLHQESALTSGIISKVEKGVLISDVKIDRGSSGGPLLNMEGEAVGLTTFGGSRNEDTLKTSGIVSIDRAIPVLHSAKLALSQAPVPSAELLPDVNPVQIPSALLSAITTKDFRSLPAIKAPHNCETYFDTAFMVAARQAHPDGQAKKRSGILETVTGVVKEQASGMLGSITGAGKEPISHWSQYADPNDAVVMISVRPLAKETNGSVLLKAAGSVTHMTSGTTLEFRYDFYDMQLLRDGVLVQPVRRTRVPASALYEDQDPKGKDLAYGGVYLYDYSAFDTSASIVLKFRRPTTLDHWDEIHLDPKLQKNIWEQFAKYRDVVAHP